MFNRARTSPGTYIGAKLWGLLQNYEQKITPKKEAGESKKPAVSVKKINYLVITDGVACKQVVHDFNVPF